MDKWRSVDDHEHNKPLNETGTCRRNAVPKHQDACWQIELQCINEQVTLTDGRIVRITDIPLFRCRDSNEREELRKI